MTEGLATVVLPALLDLFRPEHLSFLVLGVVVGLLVGVLPGLGGLTGMALVLPLVYGMEPTSALAMMIGLTSVTTTSDTFPSILVGIPGSSSSQATVLDGYPLARQGEAGRALAASFAASMVGGVFGAVVLTLAVFTARPLLLMIGFGEQLMLLILSLTMVGMLTGPNVLKGLAACGLGLLLGTVGPATATAEPRMTFGVLYLADGVPIVLVGLGVFALPEIATVLRFRERIADRGVLGRGRIEGLRDVWRHRWLVLRCSGLGAILGALPGIGGAVIDWLAYGHVLQTARDKSRFGKGDIRGVIAPESANNAKEGGALIPTLLFGIPGSGSMALLLAGMVLVGVQPGRQMVEGNLSLTFVVVWSIAVANLVGAGICFGLANPISRLTTVRFTLVAPFLIVLVFVAAYQATGGWGDLIALALFGLLGNFLRRFGWSRPAFLVGFVLSHELEAAFYRTAQIYGIGFLARPTVLLLLAAVLLTGLAAWRTKVRVSEQVGTPAAGGYDRRLPQLVFAAVLLLVPVVVVLDTQDLRLLGQAFPMTVAAITAVLLLACLFRLATAPADAQILWNPEAAGALRERSHLGGCTALVALLLGLAALIGFVVAAPVFVALFLRLIARAAWRGSVLGALAVLAGLMALALTLDLEHAPGWLLSMAGAG